MMETALNIFSAVILGTIATVVCAVAVALGIVTVARVIRSVIGSVGK